jgi:hypothetical protein
MGQGIGSRAGREGGEERKIFTSAGGATGARPAKSTLPLPVPDKTMRRPVSNHEHEPNQQSDEASQIA